LSGKLLIPKGETGFTVSQERFFIFLGGRGPKNDSSGFIVHSAEEIFCKVSMLAPQRLNRRSFDFVGAMLWFDPGLKARSLLPVIQRPEGRCSLRAIASIQRESGS
jgi:hypothetical protein